MKTLVSENKINKAYFDLYNDIVSSLNNGLITKQINSITDMTAKNRMTRDAME